MRTSTKIMFAALPVAGIVAIFDPAAGAFWAILITILLGVKGLVTALHDQEMYDLQKDKQRIRDAGGTEAEANIFASLERQRRNAWWQTSAQAKH